MYYAYLISVQIRPSQKAEIVDRDTKNYVVIPENERIRVAQSLLPEGYTITRPNGQRASFFEDHLSEADKQVEINFA